MYFHYLKLTFLDKNIKNMSRFVFKTEAQSVWSPGKLVILQVELFMGSAYRKHYNLILQSNCPPH